MKPSFYSACLLAVFLLGSVSCSRRSSICRTYGSISPTEKSSETPAAATATLTVVPVREGQAR